MEAFRVSSGNFYQYYLLTQNSLFSRSWGYKCLGDDRFFLSPTEIFWIARIGSHWHLPTEIKFLGFNTRHYNSNGTCIASWSVIFQHKIHHAPAFSFFCWFKIKSEEWNQTKSDDWYVLLTYFRSISLYWLILLWKIVHYNDKDKQSYHDSSKVDHQYIRRIFWYLLEVNRTRFDCG